MEVLGIIIARKGSKGVPGKNVKFINGRPLISYTIDSAKKSKLITKLILSTDCDDAKKIAINSDIEVPFKRPSYLSKDDTPGLPVIKHAVDFLRANQNYRPDLVIVLQPTSPMRTEFDIDDAISLLISSKSDSVVSVVKAEHSVNPFSVMQLNKEKFLTPFLEFDEVNNLRQKKPIFYARNGAIYAFTFECLINKNSIYGDLITPYFMEKKKSFDIDDYVDWEIVEYFLRKEENEK